jgi:3-hydroxyacyl-[acyl-carrier-protein] dehydratase
MKDFYTVTPITAKDNCEYTFGVLLNKTHRIYQGHFPQQPVVPGVCMVMIIRELAESVAGHKLMFSKLNNIKFLSLVDPTINQELIIKISLETAEPGYSVKASIEFADKIFLTLKGNLTGINTSTDTSSAFDNLELEN